MELFYLWRERLFWTLLLAGLIWVTAGIVAGDSINRYDWRTVALSWAAAVVLRVFYTEVIYAYFLDPLRHLPTGMLADGRELLPITDVERGKRPLEWVKKYPGADLIKMRILGSQNHVLVVSPQAHRDVLNTYAADFEKPEVGRNYLGRLLGNGLILSEGPEHKRQRRSLDPSFKIQNIRALQVLIAEKIEIMMERMSAESGMQGSIEIASWGSRFTLDIIGPTLMSTDFQSLTTEGCELERAFACLTSPSKVQTFLFMLSFFFPSWIVRKLPVRGRAKLDENVKIVRNTCRQILDRKLETFKDAKGADAMDATADILGSIISDGELNKEDLVDQMVTFVAAGHETTAASIAWVTHLLTLPKYQHYQTKIRDEVRDAMQQAGHTDLDQPPPWEILESLPLVNAICEETLRLYPPVTSTARKAIRNSHIAGIPIPKNTIATILPWVANRNPEFWGPNADDMVPERWISQGPGGTSRPNKTGSAVSNMCNQTFLHGHRSCIGRDFAKAELRTFVAVFFTRFTARRLPGDNGEVMPSGSLTIKPKGGLKVSLEPYVDE